MAAVFSFSLYVLAAVYQTIRSCFYPIEWSQLKLELSSELTSQFMPNVTIPFCRSDLFGHNQRQQHLVPN